MSYSERHLREFEVLRPTALQELRELAGLTHGAAASLPQAQSAAATHLKFGVGRRLNVMGYSIETIFRRFPPGTTKCLTGEARNEVDVNLQCFHINVSGIWDNWAWAYLLRHDHPLATSDRRTSVGMFTKATRRVLPQKLLELVKRADEWHEDHAKVVRDTLAHRIPPYLPPSELDSAQQAEANELMARMNDLARQRDFDGWSDLLDQLQGLGSPCTRYVVPLEDHAQVETRYLHFQMLSDARAIAEFGRGFLEHWHEPPTPAQGT